MMSSRGMGSINPSKMPGKKTIKRKDNPDDVEMYAEGGLAQQAAIAIAMKKEGKKPKKMAAGKLVEVDPEENPGLAKLPTEVRNKMGYMKEGGGVNAAGNYTKPGMRKALFNSIKARAVQGTGAGEWSARKAQLLAKEYKAKGGGYK
jgi:hypothetical protein